MTQVWTDRTNQLWIDRTDQEWRKVPVIKIIKAMNVAGVTFSIIPSDNMIPEEED